MLSRLSAANSHDRLIEELDSRGPDKRGCTVLTKLSSQQTQYDKLFSKCVLFSVFMLSIVTNRHNANDWRVQQITYCATSKPL